MRFLLKGEATRPSNRCSASRSVSVSNPIEYYKFRAHPFSGTQKFADPILCSRVSFLGSQPEARGQESGATAWKPAGNFRFAYLRSQGCRCQLGSGYAAGHLQAFYCRPATLSSFCVARPLTGNGDGTIDCSCSFLPLFGNRRAKAVRCMSADRSRPGEPSQAGCLTFLNFEKGGFPGKLELWRSLRVSQLQIFFVQGNFLTSFLSSIKSECRISFNRAQTDSGNPADPGSLDWRPYRRGRSRGVERHLPCQVLLLRLRLQP